MGNWKTRLFKGTPINAFKNATHSSKKITEVDPKREEKARAASAASAAKYMSCRSSDFSADANEGTSSSSSSSIITTYEQLDGMDWKVIQLYVHERMQKEIAALKTKQSDQKEEEEEEEEAEDEEEDEEGEEEKKSKHFSHSYFLHPISCHAVTETVTSKTKRTTKKKVSADIGMPCNTVLTN